MKYLITTIFVITMTFVIKSQSYSILYDNGTQTDWVHITIDTNYTSNSVFVEKVLVENSVDTVLDQHTLLLLGDYSYDSQTSAELNYIRYNYFWIPFDPSNPFYNVDLVVGSSVQIGTLVIANVEMSADPGDFTYWCTCGGHTPDAQTPGGCVSNMSTQDGKIRCIKEGSECQSACIGTLVEGQEFIPGTGGGILIQVSSDKSRLFHNFGSVD